MLDQFGRTINYMRISLTDRCNLRCRYCMPSCGVESVPHGELLTYEEILRLMRIAVSLGVERFKITGGEPLVRAGCVDFLRRAKRLDGVRQVTLTTNGLGLESCLDELADMGLDGVNISLDTTDAAQYRALTRSDASVAVPLHAIQACATRIPTKVNIVLLKETEDQILPLASLAKAYPVDVRFIELMPIGCGKNESAFDESVLSILRSKWTDLAPTAERRGNGPAMYYRSAQLQGCIGLIQAVHDPFCASCNRVRLTSTGYLKPCLCYSEGADLRALLRTGADDSEIRTCMERTIYHKFAQHQFANRENISEQRLMSQIGG